MRFQRLLALTAACSLAFSVNVYADIASDLADGSTLAEALANPANADDPSLAALTAEVSNNSVTVESITAILVANGTDAAEVVNAVTAAVPDATPAALATALTTALVDNGASAAEAAVTATVAVPAASAADVSAGLQNAGVAAAQATNVADTVAAAVAVPAPVPGVAAADNAGILVDANGEVLDTSTQANLEIAVASVVASIAATDTSFFTAETVSDAVETVVANAENFGSEALSAVLDIVTSDDTPADVIISTDALATVVTEVLNDATSGSDFDTATLAAAVEAVTDNVDDFDVGTLADVLDLAANDDSVTVDAADLAEVVNTVVEIVEANPDLVTEVPDLVEIVSDIVAIVEESNPDLLPDDIVDNIPTSVNA